MMSEDDDLIARHHSGVALTPEQWARVNAILATAVDRANAQSRRFAKFKENQKALGRIRRDYFATPDEHAILTETLRAHREQS
jgi:hypothetical protein